VAEPFEFAHEVALAGVCVVPALEVVPAEVLVRGGALASTGQMITTRVWANAEDCLALVLAEAVQGPPVQGGQVAVFGVSGGPGRLAQRRAEGGVALAGFAGAALAGRLVLPRGRDRPRRRGGRRPIPGWPSGRT
jgi:hypothetical protein